MCLLRQEKKYSYLLEKVWLYSERKSSIPPEKVKAASFSVQRRNAPAKYKICNLIVFKKHPMTKDCKKIIHTKENLQNLPKNKTINIKKNFFLVKPVNCTTLIIPQQN